MGNENKKYELTDETIEWVGRILHRIKARKNIGWNIGEGDLGGYIESEKNLSQEGNCWVYDNAKVYDDAIVKDNAGARSTACINGNAEVSGCSNVSGNAYVMYNAKVLDHAFVSDDVTISDNAILSGYAEALGCAQIYENAVIKDHAKVFGKAIVSGNAIVSEYHVLATGECKVDLSVSLVNSIVHQTGLVPFNNKVIAYKQVNKNMTSLYDPYFIYAVGKVIEAKGLSEEDYNNESCAPGLHFSNAMYWSTKKDLKDSLLLIAEINLEDIITVQQGKIRCKKAKILGVNKVD